MLRLGITGVAVALAKFGNFDDVIDELNQQIAEKRTNTSFGNFGRPTANDSISINRDVNPGLRNGVTFHSIEVLNKYGCWCYRGAEFGRGLGHPVDDYDKVCRTHHHGYECIILDADANGATGCDPVAVSAAGYNFDVNYELDEDGHGFVQMSCDESLNNDWCTLQVCRVDLLYISNFWALAMNESVVNKNDYSHPDSADGGVFNPDNCPIGGKAYHPVKACCGAYPKRRVFRTDAETDGNRQCCDLQGGANLGETRGKVFLRDEQVCCADSLLGVSGVFDGDTCP